MVCDLSNNDLRESLEDYVNGLIEQKYKNLYFDYNSIISTIYDDIKTHNKGDIKQALGIAYHVPRIILDMFKSNENLDEEKFVLKGYDPKALILLAKKLDDAENKLESIAEHLGVELLDIDDLQEIVNEQPTDSNRVIVTKSTGSDVLRTDKKLSAGSLYNTVQVTNLEEGEGRSKDIRDSDKLFYQNVLYKVLNAGTDQPDFTEVTYNGKTGFKGMIMLEKNVPGTKRKGREAFYNKVSVMVITDNDGNVRFFNQDGTIGDENTGKPVYFVIRSTTEKTKENILSSIKSSLDENLSPKEQREILNNKAKQIEDQAEYLEYVKSKAKNGENTPVNIVGGFKGVLQNIDRLTTEEQGLLSRTLGEYALTDEEKKSIDIFPEELDGDTEYIPAIKFDDYDTYVTLKNSEKIGDQDPGLLEHIVNVLTEDIISSGKALSPVEKQSYVEQFININQEAPTPKKLKRKPNTPRGYSIAVDSKRNTLKIILDGNTVPLKNKEEAKAMLKEFLSTNTTIHFHKKSYATEEYDYYDMVKTDEGFEIAEIEKLNYFSFIADKFTPRAVYDSSNGRPSVFNGYFSFQPILTEAAVNEKTKAVNKLQQETKDDEPDDINILRRSKLLETVSSEKQNAKARNWWLNSAIRNAVDSTGKPLFTLNLLRNIANSDAWATFSGSVITLYKGADYTDVYHEAWHAFSQVYLSYADRTKLYESVKKLKGTFEVTKRIPGPGGNKLETATISFADATREEAEEFIAEQFRIYALNNGNFKIKTEKTGLLEKIFDRVWKALKALVGTGEDVDFYSNPGSEGPLGEIFNTLYQAKSSEDLMPFKASMDNAEFGVLNSGVLNEQGKTVLTLSESLLLSSTIDGIISNITTRYVKDNYFSAVANFFKSSTAIINAYNEVKEEFNKKREEFIKERSALKENQQQARAVLTEKINLLEKAVSDTVFGNAKDISKGKEASSSIIAFHRANSAFKNMFVEFKYVENDPVDIADDELEENLDGRFEMANNSVASEDLADSLVTYLVSSLTRQKKNGEPDLNELGFAEPIEFLPFWRVLMEKASGETSILGLYNKLEEGGRTVSPLFTQLLSKISNISKNPDAKSVEEQLQSMLTDPNSTDGIARLWYKLWQALNLHKTDLYVNQYIETKEGLEIRSGKVTADYQHITNTDWPARFQQEPAGPFIVRKDQVNQLRLQEIVKRFIVTGKNTEGKPTYNVDSKNYMAFLNSVGIFMSDNTEIRSQLLPSNINFIADAIGKTAANNRQALDNFKYKEEVITNIVDFLKRDRVLSNGQKIPNNSTALNSLAEIEAMYSDKYANSMRYTADDSLKSIYARNSTDTRKINALQKAKRLGDLFSSDPEFLHMNYLNPENNPLTRGLVLMKSLFNQDDLGTKKSNNNIHYIDLSGDQYRDSDGNTMGKSRSKMNLTDRVISLVVSTLKSGVMESLVPSDKSSYFGIKVDNIDTYKGKKTKFLYVDTSAFLLSQDGETSITGIDGMQKTLEILYPKLEAEIRRIQKIASDLDYYNNRQGFERGTEFDIFDDMLSPELKKLLKSPEFFNRINTVGSLNKVLIQDKVLKNTIDKDLSNSLYDLAERNDKNLFTPVFGSRENFTAAQPSYKTVFSIVKENLTKEQIDNILKENNSDAAAVREAALMSYTINNFIHKNETTVLLQGDGIQFNYAKDDTIKRVPGSQAGGTIHAVDKITQAWINLKKGRPYEKMLLEKGLLKRKKGLPLGIRPYNGIFNTGVIKESVVKSIYLKNLSEVFMKDFLSKKYTEDEAKKATFGINPETGKAGDLNNIYKGGKLSPYASIEDGDGQGWISFDSYRILKLTEGDWSDPQENLYMKIVNGETVNAYDVVELFPVYKQQYNGPLVPEKGRYPAVAFHKFSLMPIIPGVFDNSGLEKIHKAMMAQNMDYVLFPTGSKRTFIKASPTTIGDEIYVNGDTSNVLDYENITFTNNPIYVAYLKNQTTVNKYFKNQSTFSTQLRKLVTSGMFEFGVPVDYIKKHRNKTDEAIKEAWEKLSYDQQLKESKFFTKSEEFSKILDQYIEAKTKELLEDLGWSINPETGEPEGDMATMVNFLVKEFKEQGLTDHELEPLNISGNLEDLDLSLSALAPRLDKLLMSIVNNRLVRTKLKGEPYVEGSSAFTQSDRSIRLRKPTAEEEAEHGSFGTNGLSFYRIDPEGKKNTLGFAFKRAFTKADMGLFQTAYFVQNEKGEWIEAKDAKGRSITVAVYEDKTDEKTGETKRSLNFEASLDRLNDMLRVENWRLHDRNYRKIRLTGVRIPVQGDNSMEFGEVAEFLKPSAGPIIIIPAEIVAKSGTDFDVDKMTCYLPFVTKNGKYFENVTLEELEKREAAANEKFERLAKVSTEIEAFKDKKTQKWKKIGITLNSFRNTVEREAERMLIDRDILKALTNAKSKELLTYLSDPKIQKYMKNWFPKSLKFYEKNIKGVTIEEVESIEKAIENLYQEKGPLYEAYRDLSDIEEQKKNITGGIQNALIDSIIGILELPEKAASLVSPNDTNIAKPIADKMKGYIQKADDETDYNKSRYTGKAHTVNGKAVKGTTPTNIYTEDYNTKKQQEFTVSKDSLGIAAVDNYTNIQLNMAGGAMRKTASFKIKVKDKKGKVKEETIEIPLTLKVKHRTLNGAISLSHILDVENKHSIADVINQLMNGFVDAGKDPWIAYLQGNLEVVPKLLFLIEAGVPLEDAVYLVSNPMVRTYVKEKSSRKSVLSKLIYGYDHRPGKAKEESIDLLLNEVPLTTEAREYMGSDEPLAKLYGYSKALEQYYVSSFFTKNGLENIAKSKLDTQDPAQIAAFFQYLYLEQLIEDYDFIKRTINPDTKTTPDLFSADIKMSEISKARKTDTVDNSYVNFMENRSIIAPYFIQKLARALFSRLFKLRDNSKVNKFLIDIFSDRKKASASKRKTGYDAETYPTKFKNFIAQYIFAQELRTYTPGSTTYKGKPISDEVFKQIKKDFVTKAYEEGNTTANAYPNREKYLAPINPSAFPNYSTDPATDKRILEDFTEFVLEREYLRDTQPMEDMLNSKEFILRKRRLVIKGTPLYQMKDDESIEEYNDRLNEITYEDYLANQALKNTYNTWQLFRSGENTVVKELLDIIQNYPEIGDSTKFSILKQFAPSGIPDDKRYKNVSNFLLNSGTKLDERLIIEYSEQWKKLTKKEELNIIGERLDGETEEQYKEKVERAKIYISNFFSELPIYSFLQSGMDSSKFSLSSVMPYDRFKGIMQKASKNLLTKLELEDSNKILSALKSAFESEHSVENSKLRNRGLRNKRPLNYMPFAEMSIYEKPYIRQQSTGSNIFILDKEYFENGETKEVTKDEIEKLKNANKDVKFILSPQDLVTLSAPGLTEQNKMNITAAINALKGSDIKLVVYVDAFVPGSEPIRTKAQTEPVKSTTKPKLKTGSYVGYNGEFYIVTKKNPNNTWQILHIGAKETKKVSVSKDKLKVFEEAAKKVTYKGIDYLVTPKNFIIALEGPNRKESASLMKWQENNGNRVAILNLAKAEPEVETEAPESTATDFKTITEFTSSQKQKILTTFANKHSVSQTEAEGHITRGLENDREETIKILKECYL